MSLPLSARCPYEYVAMCIADVIGCNNLLMLKICNTSHKFFNVFANFCKLLQYRFILFHMYERLKWLMAIPANNCFTPLCTVTIHHLHLHCYALEICTLHKDDKKYHIVLQLERWDKIFNDEQYRPNIKLRKIF